MLRRSDHRRGSSRPPLLPAVLAAILAAMFAPSIPAGATTSGAPGRAGGLAAIDVGVVGTVTDGASGLGGIDVRVYDAVNGSFTGKTRTLDDGTYELAVGAGTYKVRFSDATGSWRLQWFSGASTIDTATPVTVSASGTTSADAALVRPLTLLTGQAETATDRIIPLAGISVRVYDATASTFVAKTTSGADGSYRVADLAPGRYLVRFSDPADVYGLTWYPTAASILGAAPVVVTAGSP